jgi:excisionase family DNA binding protein
MDHPVVRKILTAEQAAELIGMDPKTVTRWARAAYIPAHPLGEGKRRFWRFFEDELIHWLERQQNAAAA